MRSANSYGKLPSQRTRKKRNKKNILIISEFFPTKKAGDITGGVEASMFFLGQELAKRQSVTILCSRLPGSRSVDYLLGFRVIRVGLQRPFTAGVDFTRIFYIISAIWKGRTINADIVVGTNLINQVIAYWIGKIKKIPVICWTPDVWKGKWFKNMRNIGAITGEFIERYNLSHQNVHFIAISKTVAHKMRISGVHKSLITVLPCGVDINLINKIKANKIDKIVLCMTSRLIHYKRLDVAIRAFSIINMSNPHIQLKIIGQGPEKKNLMQLTTKLGISSKVTFLGHIPSYVNLIKELKSSTLFVFPSTTEGFGIVTLEAMAAGIPFVIADTEVNREITKGKGGLFFKSNDHKDCAKKILKLLSDITLYNKAKKEGTMAVQDYTWSKIAAQFETYIKNIV